MPQAIASILLATLLFTSLNICVKFLPHLPTSEIVLFRGVIAAFLCYVSLKRQGIALWGSQKKMLFWRGLFGTLSLFSLFYCLHKMPLAMAMMLSNLAPLFTVIIAHFYLKESGTFWQWIFLGLAFGGVILVKGWDGDVSWWHASIGVFGAFMAGCAYTCVRLLRTTEHPLVVVFSFPVVSVPLMIIPASLEWVTPSGWDWMFLIVMGVLTQFAQYFMTVAYQLERAAKIMVYNYAGVAWAVAVGWFFFKESLQAPQIIGLLVILLSLVATAQMELRRARRERLKTP